MKEKPKIGKTQYFFSFLTFIPLLGTLIALVLLPISLFSKKYDSKKIAVISLIGLVVSTGILFICFFQKDITPTTLKNGNQVYLLGSGPVFNKEGKGIKLTYQTMLPKNQTDSLKKEVELVWDLFKPTAEESKAVFAILEASQPRVKTGFFTYKISSLYTFIIKKNQDNKWYFIRENSKSIQTSKNESINNTKAALDDGIDLKNKTTDQDHVQTFCTAVTKGNFSIVKHLLEKGVNVDTKINSNGITPLFKASENGHTEVVKLFLKKGAEIDVKVSDMEITPLWIASENGHTEIVKLLLEKGADIDVKDKKYGATPLSVASEFDHAEIVKLLLEKGANVNLTDKQNISPLGVAALKGHVEVINCLLKWGAKIDIRDKKNGMTPLLAASHSGHIEVVKLLLDQGANIDTRDTYNLTPLLIATRKGYLDVIKLLLDKGADINAMVTVDNIDYTPLKVAKKMGRTDIVTILEKNSAAQ